MNYLNSGIIHDWSPDEVQLQIPDSGTPRQVVMRLEVLMFRRCNSIAFATDADVDFDVIANVGLVEVAVLEEILEGEKDLANPGIADEDEVVRLPVEPVVPEAPLGVAKKKCQ